MENMNQTDTAQAQAPQNKSGKPYNLAPNVEAALSYVLGLFSGVFVLLMEKENKFVRFHAMQSVVFGIASFIINVGSGYIPTVGFVIGSAWGILSLVLWVYLIYQAYNNVEFELPVLGKIARDQINK